MALRRLNKTSDPGMNPEEMFRDIKIREIKGPLPYQAEIWREYCKDSYLKSPNLALQLPTGSGKTLVGIGIAEWRRRKLKEKVVYLCPTNQLVNQVVEQSHFKYGIKTTAFTGKRVNYSPVSKAEYARAETVAVTTYSALFNTNPFFDDPDLIILDDAHASESYIAKFWSLLIDNEEHEALFKSIVSLFREILTPSQYSRLDSTKPTFSDYQWIDKIPTPSFYEKIPALIDILKVHTENTNLTYTWSIIQDHMHACQMYLSAGGILIRPVIPPTLNHVPFAKAKQRICMSATLGEGGDLERITGIPKIDRLALSGWDKQGIGRRFFIFPEVSMTEEQALSLSVEFIKNTERALILVPNDRQEEEFRKTVEKKCNDYKLFDADQIEKSKNPFISEPKAVAIVANRYDGIDLPDNECRLLIVSGIQRATNLQERFLVTRMPAGILFTNRILTRTIQAVGRCTRADTDYAAVIILGEDLSSKYLLNKERQSLLHPEIQAELEYGYQLSKGTSKEEFLENFRIFLEHQDEWNVAEEDIISERNQRKQTKLLGTDELGEGAIHEIKYQYYLWKGDFEGALQEAQNVTTKLSGGEHLKGYRAFWYYLSGSAAWMASKTGKGDFEAIARDCFRRSATTAEGVTWLFDLTKITSEDIEEDDLEKARLASLVEGLSERLIELKLANNQRFEAEAKEILDNLNKDLEEDPKAFENGHERLGHLLGYLSGNSYSDGAPDPWWIAGDDFCIVFEDYNGQADKPLGAEKVRQALVHPKWIRDNQKVSLNAEIISAVITSRKTITQAAKTAAKGENIGYWNKSDFLLWAERAIAIVRSLRTKFPGEADLAWRQMAIQAFRDGKLDPNSLKEIVQAKELSSLPVSK